MTFLQVLGLLLLGFVFGMFSPIRLGMGFNIIHESDIKDSPREQRMLSEIAKHARAVGEDEFADVVERTMKGESTDKIVASMSPKMKAKWEAFREAAKDKKGD